MTDNDPQDQRSTSNRAANQSPQEAALTTVRETSYNIQHENPSEAVVSAIAEIENINVTEVEPLYDVIDPDALDSLFSTVRGEHEREGSVTFSLHGYYVFVHSDGQLIVHVEEKEGDSG